MKDITDIITELLEHAGVPYSGVTQEEIVGQSVYRIDTTASKQLIGMRGETLRALEYLVRKMAETAGHKDKRFILDIDGYRTAKITDIQQKALMMAERAKSFEYDVELTPMSAYERLIVHAALGDTPGITTESKGDGKERRVVIKYIGKGAE